MAILKWDQVNEREYETGISKVVLFPAEGTGYGKGVAWNGVTGVTQSPSGGDATKLYANNTIYGTMYSAEEYGGTIEAYMSPEEFDECDGTKSVIPGLTGIVVGQQTRKSFGFAYRTEVGNDVDGNDYGYIIHIVYGAKVSPSERSYQSINESPEAMTLSWSFTTTPVDPEVAGLKPFAHLEIDTTRLLKGLKDDALVAMQAKIATLEGKLYGTSSTEPTLPSIKEIKEIFEEDIAGEDDTP